MLKPRHALCTVQDAQHQLALVKENQLEALVKENKLDEKDVDQLIEKYLAAVHHPSNDALLVCDTSNNPVITQLTTLHTDGQ
jgi:hypothetical protein